MSAIEIKKQVRVVVYELDNGTNEIFIISYGRIENGMLVFDSADEQHERASAEREMRNPESHIVGFRFEWRDAVPEGKHCWYEVVNVQ